MTSSNLESAIQKELGRVYLCTLAELSALLPQFSPAQVAAMVERLTREGVIACRSSEPSRTILWLPPARPRRRTLEEPVSAAPLDPDSSGLEYEAWTPAVS